MLIELESLSGDGGQINFLDGRSEGTPFALTRPTHLPLSKRNTFSPTLPPTPEFMPLTDRSYCSLPAKSCPTGISTNDVLSPASRASSCIITTNHSRPYAVDIDGPKDKGTSCSWWMRSRWLKLTGKSPPRRDVTVKCDIINHHVSSRKTPSSIAHRRRVSLSQTISLFGKENKREWGEERHNDVVYAVMLKRIRKAPSASKEVTDGLQWETHKVRHIKGATLPYLVGHLCQSFVDGSGERNFLTVFLATYRSFATPSEVLDLIMKEADKIKEDSSEKRDLTLRSIIRVLKTWLERYFDEDFYDPPYHALLKKLQTFAQDYQNDEAFKIQPMTPSPDNECDFLTFVKSKVQSAEVKGLQKQPCGSSPSTAHYSDIHDETEDVCVEEESLNMDAAKTFLNLLPSLQIAEQLTVKDANLFLRVVPYHCLNAVRSSKEKPATVKATIDQFNKVVYCVLGTCLCPGLKASQRAKIICKWIEVAQECRELKNFSSLRAIVSGLQTHSIHRLKRTWQHVPNACCNLFVELGEINIKDLIKKVGTAKVNTEKSSISRVRKDASNRRQQAIHSGIMQGTVPYLGSFLTDLTYLHTAKPDFIDNGLINFNKRRMEFEYLAQLQLWQASWRGYQRLDTDSKFSDWFSSVTLPSDDQAIQLSEEIEPPHSYPLSPASTPLKRTISEMFANHNGGAETNGSSITSLPHSIARSFSNDIADIHDLDSEASTLKPNGNASVETSHDEGRTINVQVIKKSPPESGIIKPKDPKEMKLSSNDRSPAFMKKAFDLFDLQDEDIRNFKLVQILSDDKELLIPETGNVFYAMNSATKDYNFVLVEEGAEVPREKKENYTQTLPPPRNKSKRHQRKTTSSTSSALPSASPMKSIYRHFGMNSMSNTSGSYSPSKELQKHEEDTEIKSDSEGFRLTPQLMHRKKSADDSISTATHSSEGSSDESDNSFKQKVWKKLTGNKGHRRNFSDTGSLGRNMHENNGGKPTTRRLVSAITDSILLPNSTVRQADFTSSESSSGDYCWPLTSSDGELEDSGSTRTRQRGVSISYEQRLHRKAIVRKHHSHPKEAGASAWSKSSKPAPKSPAKVLKKGNSRSKFYIECKDEPVGMRRSDSMQPIHETENPKVSIEQPEKSSRVFERSASEPCILECGENEVFQDVIQPPTITVQSPSPKKPAVQVEMKNEDSPSHSGSYMPRIRRASETRTTIL